MQKLSEKLTKRGPVATASFTSLTELKKTHWHPAFGIYYLAFG